jgi:hypothetical protein
VFKIYLHVSINAPKVLLHPKNGNTDAKSPLNS